MWQICGRKYLATVRLSEVRDSLQKTYHAYGHRALAAARDEGIDWKAISHALRAAFQMYEILSFGDLQFPLQGAHVLSEVKQGRLNYTTQAAPLLEEWIDAVEALAAESTLPSKPDRRCWMDMLIRMALEEVMLTDMDPFFAQYVTTT